MREIVLNKDERYFLDGKFFLIKSGKLITRELLETGRVITNEVYLSTGEMIGNFFKFLQISDFNIPDIEIEVQAVENNTVLQEFIIDEEKLKKDIYLRNLVTILLKKVLLKFIYQLYDTKGYVLAIFKLHKGSRQYILKEEIHYTNFNISKSQFYLAYKNLQKENYITEVNEKIFFNMEKVNYYLNLLGEDRI